MNDEVRKAKNFTIAIGISFAIEKLDKRLNFPDEGFEAIECLDDIIVMADRLMTKSSPTDGSLSAKDLVDAAVKQMFPTVENPSGHAPLVDLFGEHMNERLRGGQADAPGRDA